MIWILYILLVIYLVSAVGVSYMACRAIVDDYNTGKSLYLTEMFWLVLAVFCPVLNSVVVIEELDVKSRLSGIVLIKGKKDE